MMKKTLLRTPAILPDETLSSWLIRTALHHGCDTLTLIRYIGWSMRKWIRDIDRYLPTEFLGRLSERTGIPINILDEMQLFHLSRIHTNADLNPKKINWNWFTPSNVTRMSDGVRLSFCPHCFAEGTPYLRRHWRMSWATACTHHGIKMHHSCPECGMYFIPSKLIGLEKFISVCRHCGYDLKDYDLKDMEGIPVDTDFQKTAESILINNEAVFDGKKVTPQEWFETARYFVSVIRDAINFPNSTLTHFLGDFGIQPISTRCGGYFEHLFPDERHELLRSCAILMRQSTEDLLRASMRYGLSYNTIYSASRHSSTVLLQPWLNHLARNSVNYCHDRKCLSKPTPESAVRRKWARLQLKMERQILS